jgi:TP901 family phage tail tape measure protein
MAITAAELIARVSVEGATEATAKLHEVGAASESAGMKMGKLLLGGAVIGGAALLAIGGAAVHMAGDFQAGMTTLVTGAGEAESSLGLVSAGILKLSTDTGTSTKALTDSMFLIESANYRGAAGLQVLQTAAEGAKVGVADLTQVTDVLTTSLHDYHLPASAAVGVMNSLIEAVKNGKMHMDDLNQSLTNVLPVSAAFHVSLSDVEGALSTMAAAGDRGASAGTHLAMMFKMLEHPSGVASKAMAAMGIDSIKLAETMSTSLPDALQMIETAVGRHFVPGSVEYNRAIATMLGGSKSGMAGLELMGQSMDLLRSNTDAAAAALSRGGDAVKGWTLVQGDFNFQLDRAHAILDVVMIQLGTKLLPLLTPVVKGFADWATHTDFSGLTQTLQGVGRNLGDAWSFMQKIGGFVMNSQQWKDAAGNIGMAASQLGTFANNLKSMGGSFDASGKKVDIWRDIVNGAGLDASVFGGIVNGAFTVLNTIFDRLAGKTLTVSEVLGEIGIFGQKSGLTVVEAARLMADGLTHVRDDITGADINLKKFIDSGGKVTSSVIDMNTALKILGITGKNHILTAADAARLMALGVQDVVDKTHNLEIQLALIKDTRTQPLIDDYSIYQATLATDRLRNKLLALNGSSQWNASVNTFNTVYTTQVQSPGGHHFASGVTNNPVGQWATVGERGPEQMFVPQGASILPHGTPAPSGGGANQPIIFQVDGATFARIVLPHIVNGIRNNVGTVAI